MDLLIILTYVAFAWAMFKIFKIPVNKWTIPTAALGGIFIVSGLILLMNYNLPYTFKAQKAVISIPVVPQVTGVVIEVTDKKNTLIKKGEVLFRLDPTRYQARVDRLMADIVTAEHKQRALGAELDEMAANTQQAKATRDKFAKEYQRYARGSQAKVNLCRVAAATSGDGVYTRSETTNRGAVPSELLAATGSWRRCGSGV